MKKLPLMFLTVAAAACLTFSFTACGGGSDNVTLSEDNSNLVSDKLTSLEEWEEVLAVSNFYNYSANVTYDLSYESNAYTTRSSDTIELSGGVEHGEATLKYDIAKNTDEDNNDYITGSIYTCISNESDTYVNSNSSTTSYTDEPTYYYFKDDLFATISTKTDGRLSYLYEAGAYYGSYYKINVFGGISSVGGIYIVDGITEFAAARTFFSSTQSANELLTAEYTGINLEENYPNSTAAEYIDGCYYFRFGEFSRSSYTEIAVDEEYCDCYIKVNNGHISYIKFEHVCNFDGTRDSTRYVMSCTKTVEWNYYDYNATTVTLPDEVTEYFE